MNGQAIVPKPSRTVNCVQLGVYNSDVLSVDYSRATAPNDISSSKLCNVLSASFCAKAEGTVRCANSFCAYSRGTRPMESGTF